MSVLLPEHRERAFGFGAEWERQPSGLFLPPSDESPPPLGMDLFAGCGGFSCGYHAAGWHVIAAHDWWPAAADTYLCNLGSPSTIVHVGKTAAPDATKKERKLFDEYGGESVPAGVLFPASEEDDYVFGPGTGWIASVGEPRHDAHEIDQEIRPMHRFACEHFWLCDAYELKGETILEALDLEVGELGCVFGGPPCQGFSMANANANKDDPRNLLVFEFARLACELKPAAVCMENVPAMLNMTTAEGIPIIDALARVLEDGDFGNYDALRKSILTTAGVGAAVRAKRKRDPEAEPELEDEEAQLALEVA